MGEILKILEASLKKHGDKPLTISHLINIIKMAERNLERRGETDNYLEYEHEDWGNRD